LYDWTTGGEGFSYARPVFHLADTFYFDKQISIDQLFHFLEQLSVRYLNDRPFHAQLETTDGDYYFNIDSQELTYMFRSRRHALFTLFLDASTPDGQWIDFQLSFHPLHKGPNGEIALCSDRPDGILSLVRESIAVSAESMLVPAMQWQFTIDDAAFSLEATIRLANEISMDYLLRIPPVIFLATRAGNNYTGLSLYQLARIYQRHQDEVKVLSIGITRALTGQMMSLMFQFGEADLVTCSLSMNWGEMLVQEQIRNLIARRLAFC
jgi:hypothetical protein